MESGPTHGLWLEKQICLKVCLFVESLQNPQNSLEFFLTGVTGGGAGIHSGELTSSSRDTHTHKQAIQSQ